MNFVEAQRENVLLDKLSKLTARVEELESRFITRAGFNKQDAAAYIGVSVSSLDRLWVRGLIKRGPCCRFSRVELDRYLAAPCITPRSKETNPSPMTKAGSADARPSQGITRALSTTSRQRGTTPEAGKISKGK